MAWSRLLLPPPAWRVLLPATLLMLWPLQQNLFSGLGGQLLQFALCGLGLVPLTIVLSQLVEELVEHLGARLGGLVSVVFGNVIELMVAINALSSGLYPLVVTSIAGSVVINCLLVLGVSIVIASRREPFLNIDPHSRDLHSQQLLVSAILLALPSVYYQGGMGSVLQGSNRADAFSIYSALVAVMGLAYYGLAFVAPMSLRQQQGRANADGSSGSPQHPLARVGLALAIVTGLVAVLSDRLVGALERVVDGADLNALFVGLFLLPLFSCLSEALVAFRAASRQQMQLVMTSTVESSLQLVLFVLPLLVLVGIPMGRFLHLSLPPVALAALAIAIVMIWRITDNRRVDWYEGVQLIVLFAAMATGALLLVKP